MTEGLFILTTIFVAYVVYQVINDQKKTSKSGDSAPAKKVEQAAPAKAQAAVKKEASATPTSRTRSAPKKEEAEPAPMAVASEVKPVEPTPAAQTTGKTGLRDPKTGEVSNAYTNYRFTKRWIKEALVTEKLLPKVYKNNELNPEIETKIKGALAKLEAIDKYKA